MIDQNCLDQGLVHVFRVFRVLEGGELFGAQFPVPVQIGRGEISPIFLEELDLVITLI